jgi:hypothetical protein
MVKAGKKDLAQSERARRQNRDAKTGRFKRKNPVKMEAAAMTPQSASNAAAAPGPSRASGSAKFVSSKKARFPAAPRMVLEVRLGFSFKLFWGFLPRNVELLLGCRLVC